MTEIYDDRLAEADSTDDLLDAAEEIARELAEDHAPERVCKMCVDRLPLGKEMARDVPKANQFEDLQSAVERRLRDRGEDPYWVGSELTDEYREAYYAAAADPEDCDVCHEAKHDGIEECGHQRHGEACPVQDAEAA